MRKPRPPWRPRWNAMQSIEGELLMPDGQDVESLPLQVIDQHHFRLLEQPLWLPLRWGDLIRAQPEDNQDNSWFVESVIARAPHRYLKGESIARKPHLGLLLDAIMEAGGFWQDDFCCCLKVFLPPGFDIARWEHEQAKVITHRPLPRTHWSAHLQRCAEQRQRAKRHHRERLAKGLLRKPSPLSAPVTQPFTKDLGVKQPASDR